MSSWGLILQDSLALTLLRIQRTLLRSCKMHLMSCMLLILRGWKKLHAKWRVSQWFGLINGRRTERRTHHLWVRHVFLGTFFGNLFPRELKGAKVREFLTIKQHSISVYEYAWNFTQLYRFALKTVVDMISRMSLFVAGLLRLSINKVREAMLIGDMDISMLSSMCRRLRKIRLGI